MRPSPLRSLACLALPIAVLVGSSRARSAQEPEWNEALRGPAALQALGYRLVGPFMGGRATRAVGIAGDPSTYYLATASGGVWKTVNGGATWKPIFDDEPVSSVGAIAVAPSDPHVIYVGTGEANIRGNVAAGNGIYKSTDAGVSWRHVWQQQGQIGTMVVHPGNPDIAYAAVLGHAFGPNAERGVYRTRDGGRTWQPVLVKDAETGASDVALDSSNPNIVFAGLWQARRLPWDLVSGGPGSGLYVSRDAGDTWTALTGGGLPEGPWGKVGVAVAPSNGQRVYALIEAEHGGLFRSDDGGRSWSLVNAHRALRQRAWYYSTITVDPRDPNDVWFPQVPLLRSIDGGKTIEPVDGIVHGDNHDLWIDPGNTARMIVANDGGAELSMDGGETWTKAALPLGQFYHVSVDTRVPFHVAGAMQDLGTAQGPSNSLSRQGITARHWWDVGGGEAGHVVSDASDPNIVYAGEYLGYISRYDHRTKQARNVSAWPENPSGQGGAQMRYRFQWTAPIALSPHDPKVVYHGAQLVFRSSDGGQSWSAISGDLTRNDTSKQQWAGGPITGDNTGVETYGTVFAIAESPRQRDLIWAGSDDGLVHVTRDGGKSWKNVTAAMAGVPEWGTVSLIEPSPFDAGTAYVVVDAHRLDDMRPYLFVTKNYGERWNRLGTSLPQDTYLHVVREDPARRGWLYLGTERGVLFSRDEGATWQSLRLNMPTVPVHDLVVKGDALVVGTHGRGIWILDDLTPVREIDRVPAAGAHLFPVDDTILWHYDGDAIEQPRGENPPRGAAIYYALGGEPKGPVTIDILDGKGQIIRTLSSEIDEWDRSDDFEDEDRKADLAVKPGVQRAVWDLRHAGARKIPGAKIDTGDPSVGPLAVPGPYTVRLNVAGTSQTATFAVGADPRSRATRADLEAQLTLALEVRDSISRLTDAVTTMRSLRSQIAARKQALEGQPGARELLALADQVTARLDALEARVHNPAAEVTYDILAMKGGARLYSRLSPLLAWVSDGEGPPTQGMREVAAAQRKELDGYDAELRDLLAGDVERLNELAAKTGVAFVTVKRP